jgi:hypothetical protein
MVADTVAAAARPSETKEEEDQEKFVENYELLQQVSTYVYRLFAFDMSPKFGVPSTQYVICLAFP